MGCECNSCEMSVKVNSINGNFPYFASNEKEFSMILISFEISKITEFHNLFRTDAKHHFMKC